MSDVLRGLDAASLRIGDAVVPAGELPAQVSSAAAAFAGIQRLAVWATPSVTTCVAIAGALRAGVVAVPLDPRATPNEHAHILEDFHPQGVVAAADAILPSPVGGLPRLAWDSTDGVVPPLPEASTPALVMYTSGTTGAPKGVALSHAALTACLDGLADAWAWSPDDVLAHALPLFHVHGLVLGILGPMHVGSAVHHVGHFSPSALCAAVDEGATMVFGVPTMWSRVAALGEAAAVLRKSRLLVSGSAALPRPTYDALVAYAGVGPVERYGMTECLIVAAARADAPRSPGSVGSALPGVALRLTDVEDGIGEVEVSGPTLFDGYLHRPEATRAMFTDDGWLCTGDMASVDDAGYRVVGRRTTDLIKSGGHRIGAGEVESALLAHPGVRECAVVGAPDDDLGERIVAYVVVDGLDVGALEAHATSVLTPHKRPREYRIVGALPRNEMGKVLKSVLRGD